MNNATDINPNPNNYDSFNDYREAIEANVTKHWLIKDTVNDTVIIECVSYHDALCRMAELTTYEKAHGTYKRGKNRIMPIDNNTENTEETPQ